MNRMIRTVIWSTIAPMLLMAVPAAAQRVAASRVVDVTLQLPEQMMSASIREGGAFNLTMKSGGVEFEFVPVMQGRNGQAVTMAIYRMTPGDRSTRQLVQRINLQPGVPATLRTEPEISIVVDRVRTAAGRTQAYFAPVAPSRFARVPLAIPNPEATRTLQPAMQPVFMRGTVRRLESPRRWTSCRCSCEFIRLA